MQSQTKQETRAGGHPAGTLYRPLYHFSPPANWMNDPNGLVYFDGEYHLFYQYHPGSDTWGPMHWGHAVSRDLINWEHLPTALYPDENGMIFSGSAVVDRENSAGFGENALIAIFSYHKDRIETQNLAYSTDRGRTFTKFAGNPVIPHHGEGYDFRDPKVFRFEDHWGMALAAGDVVLFYTSPDLKQWRQSGSFGRGYGFTGGVWETPDLIRLPVNGSDDFGWILTVGVTNGAPTGGSGTQYFIGHFDGETFTADNPKDTILWADFGADFYAPQSWNHEPNQRRLLLGWMKNWQYARDVPTNGWRGLFTVIREASLQRTPLGLRLVQQPVPELQFLRGSRSHWQDEIIRPDTNLLNGIRGKALEIVSEFQLTSEVDCFGFRLRTGMAEHTLVRYEAKNKKLVVDRTNSGRVDFNKDFAGVHSSNLSPMGDLIRLHIFVDSSSVEVFANDGLIVFSECIFPAEDSQGIELFAEGGSVRLTSLDVYQLNPATFATSTP